MSANLFWRYLVLRVKEYVGRVNELEKENEKLKDQLSYLMDCSEMEIHECSHKGCNVRGILNSNENNWGYVDDAIKGIEPLINCAYCEDIHYCDRHMNIFMNDLTGDLVCEKCKERWLVDIDYSNASTDSE